MYFITPIRCNNPADYERDDNVREHLIFRFVWQSLSLISR